MSFSLISGHYSHHLFLLYFRMLWRIILIIGIGISTYIIDSTTPLLTRHLQVSQLQDDLQSGTIKWYHALHIRNSVIWFPVILVIYLSHLVIQQTGLLWRDTSIWYQLIESNILMMLLIVSGIATAWESDLADRYTHQRSSIYSRYWYILLCLCLALLTYYILQSQLSSPDSTWIYTAISICAWWLIWLVGMVIGDEQQDIPTSQK